MQISTTKETIALCKQHFKYTTKHLALLEVASSGVGHDTNISIAGVHDNADGTRSTI